jgi:O-antigen/teichoic acid export membrane protein
MNRFWLLGLKVICYTDWIASEWKPGIYQRDAEVWPLLRFGKNVSISDVATFITRNIDNLLIGWACGMTPLGFYDRAYTLMMVPLQQLLSPLSGVGHTMLQLARRLSPSTAVDCLARRKVE